VRLIGDVPEAGALFFSRNVPTVRRLVLRTGHALYYRVQGQSKQKLVIVLVLRGPGQQSPDKLLR
jgi:hypothetical protein